MSWRKNPRIEKLLEKATLETLLKVYFQRVYGKEEVQKMENALKHVFEKYPNKERLYEVGLKDYILSKNNNSVNYFLKNYFRNCTTRITKTMPDLC